MDRILNPRVIGGVIGLIAGLLLILVGWKVLLILIGFSLLGYLIGFWVELRGGLIRRMKDAFTRLLNP